MSKYRIALVLAACLGSSGPAWPDTAAPLPLKTVADIPLAGRASRFDYQTYDATRHLLFIAHLGDGAVAVVDTRSDKAVANISGLKQVHGVLAIPELGRVYASATGTRQVVAIDEKDFSLVGPVVDGMYPDGLAYAPAAHKLYISDKDGGALVVVDVRSNQRTGTIPLGKEVGNTQYDPASGHIFANVQSANELAEIDPETDRVVGRYPLPGADGNHGLLIDPTRRLAFVACEGNARLLVMDLRTMAVLSSLAIGTAPDIVAFDPGLALLYVASESGVLSMFKVADGEIRKLGEGNVAPRAHSVVVVPETHRVYLPLENIDNHPVLRVMEPAL